MLRLILALMFTLGVGACATRNTPAPIENMTNVPGYVKPVDTPTTSTANKSSEQNNSDSGVQMGSLAKPTESKVEQKQVVTNDEEEPVQQSKPVANSKELVVGTGNEWLVPTSGRATPFSKSTKGVDILGTSGQKVIASNGGKVVYSGNGLKGYGNLIIIKHDNGYLTAYAHNKTNLVKEGATVSRGDKIAEMGEDNGKSLLHFEVRKSGKPIDPIKFITGN